MVVSTFARRPGGKPGLPFVPPMMPGKGVRFAYPIYEIGTTVYCLRRVGLFDITREMPKKVSVFPIFVYFVFQSLLT